MQQRIVGFDVARALALFGMVIVNFRLAMEADSGHAALLWFAAQFEGRASALFVVLAGVGVALLTRRAYQTQDQALVGAARFSMMRRGALLVVLGLAYTPIWEADILHYYGVYFLLASLCVFATSRVLLGLAAMCILIFPLLLIFFSYDTGWDWDSLSYQGFWTWQGMFRRLLFNGFHPVFPWFAFLLWGIWLGRQALSDPRLRRKIFMVSIGVWGLTEGLFVGLRHVVVTLGGINDLAVLLDTAMIPPLPQYVLAAGSLATAVIMVSLAVADRWAESRVVRGMARTGRLSLTLYVAHVVLGMGVLHEMGWLGDQTIEASLAAAALFCFLAIIFSHFWLRRFRIGPLEWGFRTLAR